jgi:hypothetical protein
MLRRLAVAAGVYAVLVHVHAYTCMYAKMYVYMHTLISLYLFELQVCLCVLLGLQQNGDPVHLSRVTSIMVIISIFKSGVVS